MHPDPRTWRPQAYGQRKPQDLRDPLVEPAWDGIRVLAHVGPAGVSLVEDDGTDLAADHPEIAAELASSARAESLVLDGYLTVQATRSGVGVLLDIDEGPDLGEHLAQFMFGRKAARAMSGRGRAPGRSPTRRAGEAETAAADEPDVIGFVAVDLIALDGEPLLEIPLLERKRLLESALEECERIRRTPYVREPAGSFIITWRSLGFGGLAYKEANSRYLPGAPNDGWSLIAMPRR